MSAHPAPYSPEVMAVIATEMKNRFPHRAARVLDPFAGTGRIHSLAGFGFDTYGLEIEPEWAALDPRTTVGDALRLPAPWGPDYFDAIVTSPTYGNRMADHHDAKDSSKRNTYRHTLGRPLHEHNSGQLQWGVRYVAFHEIAWYGCVRALREGGLFVLNVSDHVRKGQVMPVVRFHRIELTNQGLTQLADHEVGTQRNRFGANRELRVGHEHVLVFQKGTP